MKQTNVRQFFQKFPTDEACLEHLFNVRFGQGHTCPKCEREAKWYRLQSEQAYSCQWCGHHIHPMVGSIFEKSRTPLQLWFYAIFLFTTSKHGVSGKELERQLGVTYKTAWRMAKLIREHMAEVDGEAPLGGSGKVVEVDETFVGGKTTGMDWRKRKTVVMGMLERGGDVMLKVVPDQTRSSLIPHINANVSAGTEVHTDELSAYNKAIPVDRYTHKRVNHSQDEYVGPNGETTNSIENFFGHLKRSLKGTHNNVSPKYLEAYVKEFEYRFNRRTTPEVMLDELLSRFPELGA
ncbi:IS1595 family transposase [uncultured Sulfitobacter sp.]|jgi:transposase-like protein|uniref:IS1595 family transposase n=1 Tax=uncultured Sulfitobacter sp. TaxID=191468 RepID=UPI0030D92DF5|tara:strand:- start:2504 stop:3382 length:879 start_codon:yes stop_codon:yes gene_type:complete